MAKCLIEGCERVASSRGLCHPCYQTAWKMVKQGSTTWKQLEKAGLAKPVEHETGGKFLAAFRRAEAAAAPATTTYAELEAKGDTKTLLTPIPPAKSPWPGDRTDGSEDDAAHVENFKRIFGEDGGAAQ